jgi:hypothetical protein
MWKQHLKFTRNYYVTVNFGVIIIQNATRYRYKKDARVSRMWSLSLHGEAQQF